MAWSLRGTYFENCSCDVVCPCTVSAFQMPADTERCRAVLAFHVDSGDVEGVDASGRTVVIVVDSPQLMSEGNWRLGVFMDDGASKEQAEALGAVFGGQKGGPMAALVPLIGESLGVETAPIEYADDGRRHRLKVGDAIDIEIEDYVPEGGESVVMLDQLLNPVNTRLTVARATRSRVNAFGLEFAQDGKNGHSGPFSWQG